MIYKTKNICLIISVFILISLAISSVSAENLSNDLNITQSSSIAISEDLDSDFKDNSYSLGSDLGATNENYVSNFKSSEFNNLTSENFVYSEDAGVSDSVSSFGIDSNTDSYEDSKNSADLKDNSSNYLYNNLDSINGLNSLNNVSQFSINSLDLSEDYVSTYSSSLTNVYVSAEGSDGNLGDTALNPVRSIDAALSRVADGGNIFVSSGDYNVNLILPKSVSFIGTVIGDKPIFKTYNTRMFYINFGITVNLSNICFSGAKFFEAGSIIYSLPGSTLNIENCSFEFASSVSLVNSIYSKGNLNINNSNFSFSSSLYNGNIVVENKAIISNSIFSNFKGSIIKGLSTSDVSINNCNFFNSEISSVESMIVANNILNINGSNFFNCKFGNGLIFSSSPNSKINIYNSLFSNCKSYLNYTSGSTQGGVITTYGKLIVDKCKFYGVKGINGGAIYAYNSNSDLEVYNSVFLNAYARTGGSIFSQGSLKLYNSNFTKSVANIAGAVYVNKLLNVSDCIFDSCQIIANASFSGYGGAIVSDYWAFIGYCEFKNCSVISSLKQYQAGAIYMQNGKVIYSYFTGNSVSKICGCIAMDGVVEIDNCIFINNKAGLYGSCLLSNVASRVSILNSIFESNSAYGCAGVMNVKGFVEIYNSIFRDNKVTNTGGTGGIFQIESSSYITVNYCAFINNRNGLGKLITYRNYGAKYLNFDFCWWGSNVPYFLSDSSNPLNKFKWLVCQFYVSDSVLHVGESTKVFIDFNYYQVGNSIVKLYGSAHNFTKLFAQFSASAGSFDVDQGNIQNGIFSAIYTATEVGNINLACFVDYYRGVITINCLKNTIDSIIINNVTAYAGSLVKFEGKVIGSSKYLDGTNVLLYFFGQVVSVGYIVNNTFTIFYQVSDYFAPGVYPFVVKIPTTNYVSEFSTQTYVTILKDSANVTVNSISAYPGKTVNITGFITTLSGIFKSTVAQIWVDGNYIAPCSVIGGLISYNWVIPSNYSLGLHNITIKYVSSTGSFEGSNSLNLTRIPTSIKVNPITGEVGDTVRVSGQVRDELGNFVNEGTISFTYGNYKFSNISVVNGLFNFSWEIPLNYSSAVDLIFNYSGSNKYLPAIVYSSQDSQITVGISQIKKNTSVFVNDIVAYAGKIIDIHGTVTDSVGNKILSGVVKIHVNNIFITNINFTNGVYSYLWEVPATYNYSNYILSVVYLGDSTFNSATGNGSLRIGKIETLVIVNPVNVVRGRNATISGNVYDLNTFDGVTEGQVQIFVNGTLLATVNLVNGYYFYEFPVTYAVGDYSYNVKYTASNKYLASEDSNVISVSFGKISTLIISNGATVIQGNYSNVSAMLVDVAGNILVGKSIRYTIVGSNGVVYVNNSAITDSNGNIIVSFNLTEGNYTMNYYFEEDSDYSSFETNKTLKVLPANASKLVTHIVLSNYEGQSLSSPSLITLNLSDSIGRLITGGKVHISISNKMTGVLLRNFDVITNSLGVASFLLNAPAIGLYEINCTYEGSILYEPTSAVVRSVVVN